MKNAPLVSIILPTYNAANSIRTSIASVAAQTFKNWELIIIDDYSSDNTFQIVEPYLTDPRVIYISPSESKHSVAGARNLGLDLARGSFIAFLDADDFWLPEKLYVQLDAFDPSMLGIGCSYITHNLINNRVKTIRVPSITDESMINVRNPFCMSGLLFPKLNVLNIKFTDQGHEDYIFIIDVMQKSDKLIYSIQEPLVVYSTGGISLSSDKFRSLKWWLSIQNERLGHSYFRICFNFLSYVYYALKKRYI